MHMLRLSLVLLLFFASPDPALGANFPPLHDSMVYAGEFEHGEYIYSVLLVLGKDQKFLLKEHFALPNGKYSEWEATGKWHQIRKGAFLQLSNQDGLQRLVNVGGSGNLYLGMQWPAGSQITVILRPKPREKHAEEFSRVALLCASNPTIPPRHVLESVAGNRWKITRIDGKTYAPHHAPAYVLSFLPMLNKNGGTMEFFDGIRHATGGYDLGESRVSLSAKTKNADFAKLIRETTSWYLVGEVLELWGKDKMLAVFEKIP